MRNVYISGLGAFYPNAPVDNEQIESVLGMVGGEPSRAKQLILDTCGIKTRHYALDPRTRECTHTNAEMTALAVRSAAENAGIDPAALELLCCGTSSPDQLNPGHAPMTQGELASGPLEAVSFSGFCASATAALRYAYLSIGSGARQLAAVTGSEIASAALRGSRFKSQDNEVSTEELLRNPILSMGKDFLRWILSDGAACVILSPDPPPDRPTLRIDWIDCESRAHEYDACMYVGAEKDRRTGKLRGWMQVPDLQDAIDNNYFCLTQDVALLKKSVVSAGINGVLGDIIKKRGLRAEDYDLFFPHLSSFFFEKRIAKAMEQAGLPIPMDRWYTNLASVGNLGAAAMLSIFEQAAREGKLERGQKILAGVPESGRFNYYFMQMTVV